MNLLEAISYLRTNILDDVGGLGSDWESFTDTDSSSLQLRWTNEELASNINEAINQVYRRILPVKEINTAFDITTVIGDQQYDLNPSILQIEGVRANNTGKHLERVAVEDVWGDDKLFTNQGTPTCYIPNIGTGTINFYPIPDAVETYTFMVYRLPLNPVDWNLPYNEIELREEFVIPMLWYAAASSYEKDEANTLDPNRVVYFLSKFNQEFPATSAYSDVRKRRTSNRSIRYGGY